MLFWVRHTTAMYTAIMYMPYGDASGVATPVCAMALLLAKVTIRASRCSIRRRESNFGSVIFNTLYLYTRGLG